MHNVSLPFDVRPVLDEYEDTNLDMDALERLQTIGVHCDWVETFDTLEDENLLEFSPEEVFRLFITGKQVGSATVRAAKGFVEGIKKD